MVANRRRTKQNKKVLIALSGGIDSAVSAVLLLRQGYAVEAAFMKNWSSTAGLLRNECPWIDDRREALRVAAFLGIPLRTFDFEKEYQERVMEYFFTEYAAGRTPNPDVMCNKEIKFKLLYEKAMQLGFDFLATGHYAQIKAGKLERSKDEFKDQTYFIYNLKPEQLQHVLFPIGGYLKSEVRALARKFKLPNAERKESMGLCFVGKIRLDQFLKQRIKPRPGKIVNAQGKILGRHDGIYRFTLGQREGLKIGGSGHQPPEAAFVSEEIETMCGYINECWTKSTALHLCAYSLWKLNWIHPFSDGNGRTARAVSYVVLSAKLDSLLPGSPTIPEQIATDKKPYYDSLEVADTALKAGRVDVGDLEKMLETMLARQLVSAAKQASGE